MVSIKDYSKTVTKAARSVLVELTYLLEQYKDNIVLIGGSVPEFIIPNAKTTYIGTTDVDIVLDHQNIGKFKDMTLAEIFKNNGYIIADPKENKPNRYYREVIIEGQLIKVPIDLLAGEYGGSPPARRHQDVLGVKARKLHGSSLAFKSQFEVTIKDKLPDGEVVIVSFNVIPIIAFIALKGIALHDRGKSKGKDAYDIYYCINNHPEEIEDLVNTFKSHLDNELVTEGLEKIAKYFRSESDTGPSMIADFLEINDPEDRESLQRDAYEKINYLLKNLGVF